MVDANAAYSAYGNIPNPASVNPLGGGDPLKAYFPDGTQIYDRTDAIEIREPGRRESLFYHRAEIVDVASSLPRNESSSEEEVRDVIIIGEVSRSIGYKYVPY